MAARRDAALAREARLQAWMASSPEKAPAAAPAAPLAFTLKITRERLAVFATLATIEARPLEEVIAECLADMAAHLTRSRRVLHLNPEDQAQLDAYLDALAAQQERAEWEEQDAAARAVTTPAMKLAAHASDMREAFPHHHDDEEADFARRCAGTGYVEETLAQEGN